MNKRQRKKKAKAQIFITKYLEEDGEGNWSIIVVHHDINNKVKKAYRLTDIRPRLISTETDIKTVLESGLPIDTNN